MLTLCHIMTERQTPATAFAVSGKAVFGINYGDSGRQLTSLS